MRDGGREQRKERNNETMKDKRKGVGCKKDQEKEREIEREREAKEEGKRGGRGCYREGERERVKVSDTTPMHDTRLQFHLIIYTWLRNIQ